MPWMGLGIHVLVAFACLEVLWPDACAVIPLAVRAVAIESRLNSISLRNVEHI